MKIKIIFTFLLMSIFFEAFAHQTQRISEFSNDKVNIWKTIIYPKQSKILPMHRHDYDRVIVALTDGQLKVTNDTGKFHLLTLKKDQAYYLKKDKPQEFHQDENISNHTIKVLVIELKTP